MLAALGASVGTVAGASSAERCRPCSPGAWWSTRSASRRPGSIALALALVFGLYPAIRASRLSPMEAMR